MHKAPNPMRHLFALFITALFSAPAAFSQTDSTSVDFSKFHKLKVYNPTQLFSSVGVGLNVNLERYKNIQYWDIRPDIVFSGSVKIKKLQFDMLMPIGTSGNLNTLAGDIKLRIAWQIESRNIGIYKTSLIYGGMQLPTGHDPENDMGGNAFEKLSFVGHFKFDVGYIADLRFNRHFSIYPKTELYFKANPITTSFALNTNPDSCGYPPRAIERGFTLGNTFSWVFYSGDFIQFTPRYTWGFRQSISQCAYRNYYVQKSVGGFSFDLKYQHRINTHSYLVFGAYYNAVFVKDYEGSKFQLPVGKLINSGVYFGYKYYLD